jgi:alkylation response protein AidB-like acyl-CoA dehydrogenase
MHSFRFEPYDLPPETDALRTEVRAFLDQNLRGVSAARRAQTWMAFDPGFSSAVGAKGWIGMTWPKVYGGHERSAWERYVVIEEMLAAGAPVAAHWFSDRQFGPLLLKFGTEEQRRRFLPGMARGEIYFCIGMSEPGAGSDLAAVKTRARRLAGGWSVSGQKIWTSNAHGCHYMIALVRTGAGEKRHAGLSQLLIDLKSPGITIRPIEDLTGSAHFNEVFFDDVVVPETMLIGTEGQGWQQVTAELAYERSGPERYLSSLQLLIEFVRSVGESATEPETILIGRFMAELWTLRRMSLSVTGQLAQGVAPATEAAIVKDLGTGFEQELPRAIQAILREDFDLSRQGALNETLAYLLQISPAFSLRGGAREILRGIIAREIGLR